MPYITQDRRPKLDKIVARLELSDITVIQITQFEFIYELELDGDMNYLLYAFALRKLLPSYDVYKGFLQALQLIINSDPAGRLAGELTECIYEIRRRILTPYEDQKILENGDVSA